MEEHASNRWTDYSLVCIIRRIVKEIPTVIAAGLIAAMLTVAYLQVFYKPQYTASTTVAVGMKNASYTSVFSNLSSTSEMAGTFTKLFDSTMFSTISKEKLGVEKLNGELEAFVVPQTNLMTMRVTADNPTDAFKTLRFLLDNYSAVSDRCAGLSIAYTNQFAQPFSYPLGSVTDLSTCSPFRYPMEIICSQ